MPAAVLPAQYPYTNLEKFDGTGGHPDLRNRVRNDINLIEAAELANTPLPATVRTDPRREWASACQLADGYLAVVFALPLQAWPDLLTEIVNRIAGWHLSVIYGLATDGTDSPEYLRYKDAIKSLEHIAAGKLKPPGFQDANAGSPVANLGDLIVPEIVTDTSRGWGR
jgi:phage gp36-like protein